VTRFLVTGAAGMLAGALRSELARRGHDVLAYRRGELDVSDERAVRSVLGRDRPDVVIQCAAYTAVDRAEDDAEEAVRVNASATAIVADACFAVGARLVYPSTDYVFDGRGTRPYRPGDPVDPVNAYGRSKLLGEKAARAAPGALVVRTSWLYGRGGPNFVDTMRRAAATQVRLRVVDDQVGRPTWTADLAAVIADLVHAGAEGTFHASGGGEPVTWYGFTRRILEVVGSDTPVEPVTSADFVRPAPRPAYSVLDTTSTEAAIGRPLRSWEDALREYLLGGGER
jgi:dTDP-4-dehydrorhamnose reductase